MKFVVTVIRLEIASSARLLADCVFNIPMSNIGLGTYKRESVWKKLKGYILTKNDSLSEEKPQFSSILVLAYVWKWIWSNLLVYNHTESFALEISEDDCRYGIESQLWYLSSVLSWSHMDPRIYFVLKPYGSWDTLETFMEISVREDNEDGLRNKGESVVMVQWQSPYLTSASGPH